VADADAELLDRWCLGDTLAGEELFKRHFDSIYNFFATKSLADADELTQSTFLNCLASKHQFRKDSSFRTYLFTIARNQLHRLLRSRQRHDAKLDFDHSSIAEIVTTPGSRLARDQEHRQLIETLQHLPVEQQTLLELHYREEIDVAGLAEIFDVSVEVIRTRLYRARKALREKLERLVAADEVGGAAPHSWAERLVRS
jgi:RNA polymerase sigma factor (sigma-70 family)